MPPCLEVQQVMCEVCGKVMFRKNIYSHLRVTHKYDPEQVEELKRTLEMRSATGAVGRTCPICNDGVGDQEGLANHCLLMHSGDGANGEEQYYAVHHLTFESKEIFEEECEASITSLWKTGAKRNSYFSRCSRAGSYACKEHSLDFVIRRLRSDFSARTSRLHFVTRDDLWNLIVKHGLRPGSRDDDDLTSLQMREAEHNLDDEIRFFRMPENRAGKGLALVIITPIQTEWLKRYSHRGISVDDTHNTTRYKLKLATAVVVDERDRGLPAGMEIIYRSYLPLNTTLSAFLLSGSISADDVEILFRQIKDVVPDFDPKEMATDETLSFYNGFRSVFPNSRARLHYCRRHISHTRGEKFRKLVEPRLRKQVKQDLNDLLRIGQIEAFELKFAQILADRRRLARSSSRKQQITIRHRSAVTFLAKNPQVLCVGENKGGCDCGPSPDNVHCPVCEVCPYSWTCTCIDNIAGISCKHRHVIALRDARALVVTEDTSREIFSPSLPPTIVEDSVAPAQQRLESRKAKRSDAEMAMAVVQANMNALVEEDTDEADEKLQAIVDLLREASEIQSSACSGNPPMVPRPEMKRPGRKPKLTSVKLYTVVTGGQYDVDMTKPHEKVLYKEDIKKQYD
ncbi:unnamed protein product [Nippostrongylus brasiliensis]|uniref:C2H2-type domain-containing protein n=1 Tax=Nippostrongylus brasiliensis TaxID=27835 RepID=A0A158R093_NIPBR|nr:unnamed protein product [Nippostrongylus brasiliensis]